VTAVYGASFVCFWQVRDRPPRQIANPSPPPPTEPPAAILALFRRPRVLRFVPAWLAVNTIIGVWFTHSAFQLTAKHHEGQYLAGTFSGTDLTGAFAIFGGAFIFGVWLWGLIMGTRSRTAVMLITVFGIYFVCGAVYVLNHIPPTSGAPTWPWVALFLFGVALLSGFTPAALAYLADISEETARQRGAVMGLYSVVLGLGQMIGGTLGAPFAQTGGIDGLILLTALLGTAALVTVVMLRTFDAREKRLIVEPSQGSTPA
jgi:predicted MFS family arabinose efflux permease